MTDEFENLSLPERIAACREKSSELTARAEKVSPEVASELRALALQWLVLAQQLERRNKQI